MKFGWESQEERLLRFMKISPKRKLEWLAEMNEFNRHHNPKARLWIRTKLRSFGPA